jgi:hypothetical protein
MNRLREIEIDYGKSADIQNIMLCLIVAFETSMLAVGAIAIDANGTLNSVVDLVLRRLAPIQKITS